MTNPLAVYGVQVGVGLTVDLPLGVPESRLPAGVFTRKADSQGQVTNVRGLIPVRISYKLDLQKIFTFELNYHS